MKFPDRVYRLCAAAIVDHKLAIILGIAAVATLAESLLFFPKFTTRFCYNSPNVSVTSQCVLCQYFTFDSTILACTGSSALTVNMTSSQAFCVIAQCLGQVRQTPTFLGRRRRSIEGDDEEVRGSEAEVDGTNSVWVPIEDITENPLESLTTESVELTINGKNVKYIVAKEVTADVYEPEADPPDPLSPEDQVSL